MERESSLRRSVEEAVGGGTPWMEAGRRPPPVAGGRGD